MCVWILKYSKIWKIVGVISVLSKLQHWNDTGVFSGVVLFQCHFGPSMYYFQGFRSQCQHVVLSSNHKSHFIVSVPNIYIYIYTTVNLNIARNTIGIINAVEVLKKFQESSMQFKLRNYTILF